MKALINGELDVEVWNDKEKCENGNFSNFQCRYFSS